VFVHRGRRARRLTRAFTLHREEQVVLPPPKRNRLEGLFDVNVNGLLGRLDGLAAGDHRLAQRELVPGKFRGDELSVMHVRQRVARRFPTLVLFPWVK
jgi:hypothetical protein